MWSRSFPLRGTSRHSCTSKHPATLVAVICAFILASDNGSGKCALTLWPLFGTVNQLLAGLAFLVTTISLLGRGINALVTPIPTVFMVFITGWAMILHLKNCVTRPNWLIFAIGLAVFVLELWTIVESVLVLREIFGNRAAFVPSTV